MSSCAILGDLHWAVPTCVATLFWAFSDICSDFCVKDQPECSDKGKVKLNPVHLARFEPETDNRRKSHDVETIEDKLTGEQAALISGITAVFWAVIASVIYVEAGFVRFFFSPCLTNESQSMFSSGS